MRSSHSKQGVILYIKEKRMLTVNLTVEPLKHLDEEIELGERLEMFPEYWVTSVEID